EADEVVDLSNPEIPALEPSSAARSVSDELEPAVAASEESVADDVVDLSNPEIPAVASDVSGFNFASDSGTASPEQAVEGIRDEASSSSPRPRSSSAVNLDELSLDSGESSASISEAKEPSGVGMSLEESPEPPQETLEEAESEVVYDSDSA